jgi:hypothetical protein
MRRVFYKFIFSFLLFASPLWAQEQLASSQSGSVIDNFSIVGMRVAEIIENFGSPIAVFSARGNEIWQDDVVFRYDRGDFYIYGDRVWQVNVSSELGLSVGDPRQAAVLVLGDRAEDRGNYLLMPVSGKNWPLMFRVNFSNEGRVASIFIYRPDY